MVTLYSVVNGTPILWNGSPYGQANPILSDKDGNFVFRVPNGEYLMEAGKVGYKTQRSPAITIQNNIFGRNIELLRLPEPIFTEICQIDCSSIDYDIYIVGSDGVERHINTDFVQSKDLGNGIFLYSFEVDGKDFDYNDALLQVDYSNCQRLKIIILKTSADTKQSVRVKIIYKGDLRNDVLLTADAHEEQGNTLNLNLSSDPAICESITTQVQIGAIAKQVEYAVLSALEAIQDPKLVKITDEWAAPVLTIAAASNFGTALGFINIFTYSRFLFTQPLLLFGRIRRRRWGVVYNSLTKQPIDLVIIRLLHKETGAVVQSRVTDKRGRYYFQVNPGNYTLQVVKSEYSFPTQYLGNKNVDAVYADIYHGDTINMVENGFIAYNIPMDPAIPESTPRKIIYRNFFQKLRHIIALSGAFLAVVSLVISPSPLMVALVIFQVVMYFAFRRLTLSAKAKSWGKIYDADTKKPISGAIIRIFDKKFNKLLETQLSSGVGGYGFFVEHNSYYVVVEKPGYQKYTSKTLDLGSLKESIVDLSIPLQRVTAPKT
jgi:hypothetical protein